jgi:MoxR-like ATPase
MFIHKEDYMNIKDLKASLDYLFKAQVTPFIWGHAGIGKSTVMKHYAQEKGYKYFPFYLGTMSDVGDILGLATFTKDENGNDVGTHFAPPSWLKDMIQYCEDNPESGAVIFLDEFNRGRRDILNGMFSLALDKTFHTIKLPENCHVIAAGNPPTDEYYVTDVNETALMARFAHIKLEPTVAEWVGYAQDAGFEPTLISFIQEQPDLLEDSKSTFTLPVKVDRRSYERVNRLFKVGTPPDLLDQLMVGIIGAERLVTYKLHLQKTDKPLSGGEVLSGAHKDKVSKWSNPIDIKSSLLSITCDNLFDMIQERAKTEDVLPDALSDNLMEFLEMLPREVSYPMLKKLLKHETKIFRAFITDKRYEGRIVIIAKDAKGLK